MGNALSPDLENVEREIDSEYLKNPLTSMGFSDGVFYYLAFCEDMLLKALEHDKIDTAQGMSCFMDDHLNRMKTPLRWLWRSCPSSRYTPLRYSDDHYQAGWDLEKLGREYDVFEIAYTYARAGVVKLELKGDLIIAVSSHRDGLRIEAYDRLLSAAPQDIGPDFSVWRDKVESEVKVSGARFKYKITPAIVEHGLHALEPMLLRRSSLPHTWSLPNYTLGDFRKTISVLRVLAVMHYLSRAQAARMGCKGVGYDQSILIMEKTELSNRLRRYTGLADRVIKAIVCDLTYGGQGIRNPDPAIQPLIPLGTDHIAACPSIFISMNPERNFTVLLNRLPEEKEAYSRLSTEREHIFRQEIIQQLQGPSFRFWHGRIPGRSELPDIDLCIIDEDEHTCLVLELKAFIQPAEPREVLEKSQEIARGVTQITLLRDNIQNNPPILTDTIGIRATCRPFYAVATESFIGTPEVQSDSVPIVQAGHFVRRLLASGSLSALCSWLASKSYLPVEGTHFEMHEVCAQVGRWKVQWHGIKPLISEQYY
jgi:hypothetical protein